MLNVVGIKKTTQTPAANSPLPFSRSDFDRIQSLDVLDYNEQATDVKIV
jgi:hypothetical protein